jgi:hypothetical protein
MGKRAAEVELFVGNMSSIQRRIRPITSLAPSPHEIAAMH